MASVYGDGSNGALNVTNGNTTNLALNTKYQYTTVNVASGGILTTNSAVGAVLYICATTSINISGTLDVSGKVTPGKSTNSVVIDGVTYTSPNIGNGGQGSDAYTLDANYNFITGGIGGQQSNGYGGGGAGGGVQPDYQNGYPIYKGGNGGTGTPTPGAGGAAHFRSASGYAAFYNGDHGGAGAGGAGALVLWGSGGGMSGTHRAGGGGGHGVAGQASASQPPVGYDAAGGGGSGGNVGRAGVHIVLKAPVITINGTVITAGGNGGGGGNAPGTVRSDEFGGGGGGGGGAGHGGNLYVTHAGNYTTTGSTLNLTGGQGGSGGSSVVGLWGWSGEWGNNGTTIQTVNGPPSIALGTPADGVQLTTNNPSFTFTGTDAQGDGIVYQFQLSTLEDYSFTVANATSDTDSGFSGTTPHTSGAQVTYTPSTALPSGGIMYYWRVRAKDPNGSNTWGSWVARSLLSRANAPAVTTGSTSEISTTSVKFSGAITSNGGGVMSERGFVYSTDADPDLTDPKTMVSGDVGSINATITGLLPGTTYYWRAYGINSRDTTYGEVKTFTTFPSAPTVSPAEDITPDSASIDLTVADNGLTVTEHGIVYSEEPTPTILDSKVITGSGAGSFTAELTGLDEITTYYARAYATNSQGTSYSSEITFDTTEIPRVPTVVSGTVSNITITTAEFNDSEVERDGTQTVTERGIVFSNLNDEPTIADSKIAASSGGLGTFDVDMPALEPEATYYVRAYATNSLGTGYGEVVTFTTEPLFIDTAGDGYWTFASDEGNAIVGRTQATPPNASVNLRLRKMRLTPGETYTLHYSGHTSTAGDPRVVLQWYDNMVETQQVITPGVPYTFVYDPTKLSWTIRLYVTGDDPEGDEIRAVFSDLYLAAEDEFSEYTAFVPKGLTEVKIENNWLLDSRRETTITSIFEELNGLSWTPFKMDTVGLGWFEVGDMFTVSHNGIDTKVVPWETKLTIDGGIKETLEAKTPTITQTDYNKAGTVTKALRRTQITVDKNEQLIESLVSDVRDVDGVMNTQFTQVQQDIDSIRSIVQSSGGVNLIRNSVMYAYDDSDTIPQVNVAAGKSVTLSAANTGQPPAVFTNGNKDSFESTSTAGGSSGYAQVDLGEVFEINRVVVWHYYADARTYTGPKTTVSEDGVTWTTVSEPTPYSENASGNTRTFPAIRARYIRDYINGSTINAANHWVELEAYGAVQNVPSWIISGPGTLAIQSSPESITAGGISGNQFTLSDKTATQRVAVRMDVNYIQEEEKTYYSLSARVKKNIVGTASITLTNRNETLTIDLPDQTEYYWTQVSLENFLAQDDYYDVVITSDEDADLQVTDVILAPSKSKREWTQANGETMNTTMAVMDDGVTIRSNKFRDDYTRITALGFEVHKHEAGGDRIFGFTGDETNVRKLRSEDQISMKPIRVVPIQYSTYKGWAFTRTEDQ